MVNTNTTITVQINGETHDFTTSLSLPELLEQIGMNPRLVAVEYNGEILHRQYWSETQIATGDRLEIVTIVGGG
ncbi:Thiamine biosynthesis protein ThiS [Hyella patelloides LEGE 07179]|uniref:Thiamine biosynthesis protein ThiS n=1 Tax=Hyella patelloides LEGE 07179 TaxID=945734 RepID=A0A563VZK8_9CYAN|nr:sulfur carrier protein ThiS [Hyella patelloides]VEP16884.1 Thiamine biosynthesis protein ThiS [Hyella patelloides LEGE 07179]